MASSADEIITEKQSQPGEWSLNEVRSQGLSPNRGASVRDIEASGLEPVQLREWQRQRGIDVSKQVKIVKLTHMRYQHPDLNEITTFLQDFGISLLSGSEKERWYHGYGPDQYVYYAKKGPKKFLGGAFEVESRDDLEKVISIPGVTVLTDGVEEMSDAPGGGYIVTIEDPEGFNVNFIHGQAPIREKRKIPEKVTLNYEVEKPRQRAFQRFEPGPAEVHKLGHFGLNVKNITSQMDWYTRHFNIVPTDIVYQTLETLDPATGNPMREQVALFAHIDRGQELVDHHSMFLTATAPGIEKHVHHCSFEVHDFDTQALGHQWLVNKQYKLLWGVSRHILGSQIFDYWWDTSGFMVEHYADGDVVNEDTPVAYGPAGPDLLAIWGPEVPKEFLE